MTVGGIGPTRPDVDGTQTPEVLLERLARVAGDHGRDPVDSRRELEQITQAADELGHVVVAARARYALARVLVALGEADTALAFIDAAELCLRSAGATREALRTNLGRMHVLDDLGRHEEAAAVGRAVTEELADRGRSGTDADDELTWLRAAIEENTGVALGYLGRHADSLQAYASAGAHYDRLGSDEDSARVALNRGVELCELARPAEAIDVLDDALAFYVTDGDRLHQALCLTNLSESWIARGRYLEAFNCLDDAEQALADLDHTIDWLRAQLARADCFASLNLDVEAIDLYDELVEPLDRAGLKRDLAKAQLGRGTVLSRTGAVSDAHEALDRARSLFEQTGDRALLARTCLAAAALEHDPGDSIDAAIELLSDGRRPAEYATALLAAAKHHDVTDPGRADACLEEAARLIDNLGVPDLRWQLHLHQGRSLRRAGDRSAARTQLDLAVSALNQIRASLDGDGLRQRFDGARRGAADDLVDLLLDGGEVQAAFELVDTVQGRGLVEAMQASVRSTDDATTRAELRSTYDRLLTAHGPAVAELTSRARRLERRTSPRHDGGANGEAGDGAASSLPARTVCFRVIENEVIAFVGDGRSTHVVRKVCELSRVEQLLAELVVQWRRFEHPEVIARHLDQISAATVDTLRDLHACLLGPLNVHLPESGSLTIVADGSLGAVPFCALHDGQDFLVRRLAVRQTPSIGIEALLRRRARSSRSALVLGTTDRYAPLAAAEAARVSEAWREATGRCVVLRGDDATATELLSGAAEHDVVHVAGHGLFRDDAPEFSAIRLADRWVTAAEISRLELDGQLVVLSACDTGSRHTSGPLREVMGLPRALLAAGARGVIASLWPADDAATTQLMTTLHRSLTAGATDAEALRTAQLATLADHPHPYHWASATLIGGIA